MYINPGELNKRIQIYTLVYGETDTDGFPVPPTKNIIRSCWASVTNQSGRALMSGQAAFTESNKRFVIRYTSTPIRAGMFIYYNGEDFEITYANPFKDNRELIEILAKTYNRTVRKNGRSDNGN